MPSDSDTTVAALRQVCQDFCDARDWRQYHDPKDVALCLSVEVGEILDLFRFKKEAAIDSDLQDPARRERLADEMADVLYWLLMLSLRCDVDLSQALRQKMAKNEARYPVPLAYGRNVKYTDL
ncbi:MAG TPA: nucleotide pyrophosphohydrolase [Candidatus Xenobia bacterium]